MKQKNSRRQARIYALQSLYALEFHKEEAAITLPESDHKVAMDAAYAKQLIDGVRLSLDALDERIQAHSAKRKVERLAGVDRNILRLAIWELTASKETLAPAIVINEAVALAKEFGGENSYKFIHAVLDAVAKEEQREG